MNNVFVLSGPVLKYILYVWGVMDMKIKRFYNLFQIDQVKCYINKAVDWREK